MKKYFSAVFLIFFLFLCQLSFAKDIEVYFNYQDQVEDRLVNHLSKAEKTVHIAAFEINSEPVINKLIELKNKNIEVKIVTDSKYYSNAPTQKLVNAGIPVVQDNREPFMHHKFVIIDQNTVWTGSTNLTFNCFYRNRNNAIIFKNQEMAAEFEKEFSKLFNEKEFSHKRANAKYYTKVGEVNVNYFFSPGNNINRVVWNRLKKAKKSIHIAAFSLTDKNTIRVIQEKINQGLDVKIILDKMMSHNPASASKVLNNTLIWGEGNKAGKKLHDKYMIIDEEIVITGSHNFSGNGDKHNNENLIILDSKEIAAQYLENFKKILETSK